jgi:hypothetical protein
VKSSIIAMLRRFNICRQLSKSLQLKAPLISAPRVRTIGLRALTASASTQPLAASSSSSQESYELVSLQTAAVEQQMQRASVRARQTGVPQQQAHKRIVLFCKEPDCKRTASYAAMKGQVGNITTTHTYHGKNSKQ